MHMKEVRWVRSKIGGIMFGSIVGLWICVVSFDAVSSRLFSPAGSQIARLKEENHKLQGQVSVLYSRLKDLESSVASISEDGNLIRRMVDLPAIDEETKQAGFGGSVRQELPSGADSISRLLRSASDLTEQLQNEIRLQLQSADEIRKKYEFNKNFFAALPALKPMDGEYSPSGFGVRMHPVLGIYKTHEGLDIINDVGTPVYSPGNGVVSFAGQSGGGYGTMIAIEHGFGYETVFAHLSRTKVKEGSKVKRGDLLGWSGRSGLVSGPHLHYEVRYKGVRQNPADYFFDDIRPGDYISMIANSARK